jgi:hypothetical protein
MSKIKTCVNCQNPFFGRRDAKTCSNRCRKALQRNRELARSEDTTRKAPRGYTNPGRMQESGTSLMSRHATGRRFRHLKNSAILIIFGLAVVAFWPTATAMAAVSQGYVSNDTELRQYMAVKLAGDDAQGHPVVQSTSITEQDKTIGIAVGLGDSLLTVAPLSSEVYIVSTGPAKAYVSDVNGAVKRGDLLAVSPLRGILMKSTDPTKPTVGQALEDFISKPTQTIFARDTDGKSVEVHVTTMQVDVAIKPPQLTGSQRQDNWLKSLGNSLVGHEISTVRIVASLAIFFTLMIIEGELIYGTVASTITALGRNPLARKSIVNQSFRSVRIAVVVLILGAVSVGLLLWL